MTDVRGSQVVMARILQMATVDQLRVVLCPACQRYVATPSGGPNGAWQCPLCRRRFRRRLPTQDSAGTLTDGNHTNCQPWPPGLGQSDVGQRIPRRARLSSFALSAYALMLLVLMVAYHLVMTVLAAVWLVFCTPALLWRTLGRDDELELDEPHPPVWLRPIANLLPHFRRGHSELTIGPLLTYEQSPGVFAMTMEVARTVGAPEPDEIRITHLPCCGVLEQRRWCGLRRGRRVMVLGLPIFYVLTIEELRAAVAHELSHLSSGDAALAFVISQFLDSLDQSITRGSATRWGWLNPCVLFARLVRHGFRMLASPLSRHQEYRADQGAALVCGSEVVARSLRLVALVQPVFKEVLCHYHPTVLADFNVYQFFSAAWAALDPEQERRMQESLVGDEHPHWFDPYPSLRTRLSRLEGYQTPCEPDRRPARQLLTDPQDLEELLHNHIYRTRTPAVSIFHPCGS